MESLMRIALAQYPVSSHDSLAGWKTHITNWVREACEQKAKVLVFPEYGSMELVSFFEETIQKSLPRQVQEMQKHLSFFQETFQHLSQQFDCAILAPSFPVIDQNFKKPVNRSFFFKPDGSRDFQDKIHMTRFEDESWGVGPGHEEQKVFEAFGIKLGVSICFDVEFPFAALELAKKGVQVLLAPSCTETVKGLNRVHIGARARAMENQFYVAIAQTVGLSSWSEAVDINTGQAAVYTTCDQGFPDNGTLALGSMTQEGWIYCDLDLSLISKVRESGQVFNFKNMQKYAGS